MSATQPETNSDKDAAPALSPEPKHVGRDVPAIATGFITFFFLWIVCNRLGSAAGVSDIKASVAVSLLGSALSSLAADKAAALVSSHYRRRMLKRAIRVALGLGALFYLWSAFMISNTTLGLAAFEVAFMLIAAMFGVQVIGRDET